jgi:hypothetical protein
MVMDLFLKKGGKSGGLRRLSAACLGLARDHVQPRSRHRPMQVIFSIENEFLIFLI